MMASNNAYHQPYAPSPYSYAPTATLSSTISLDEEVKLSTTTAQRTLHESLAEIYAIIVTLDFLERAFVRDSIKESEYTPTCLRLISQYKTILKSEEVSRAFGDLDTFKRDYDIEYPSATARLSIGVPATYEQPTGGNSTSSPGLNPILSAPSSSSVPAYSLGGHPPQGRSSGKAVAECTQNFITFMDALSLDFKAKDQLHPLLSNVMSSLNNVSNSDFEGRSTLVHWLIKLNNMKANEEMDKEEARQMAFDVENAYQAFFRTLK